VTLAQHGEDTAPPDSYAAGDATPRAQAVNPDTDQLVGIGTTVALTQRRQTGGAISTGIVNGLAITVLMPLVSRETRPRFYAWEVHFPRLHH
jgi:hypothetical protein